MLATFLLLFLLAELDCQSKLFFCSVAAGHPATDGGAVSTLSAAGLPAQMSKTGRNVDRKGIKRSTVASSLLVISNMI